MWCIYDGLEVKYKIKILKYEESFNVQGSKNYEDDVNHTEELKMNSKTQPHRYYQISLVSKERPAPK